MLNCLREAGAMSSTWCSGAGFQLAHGRMIWGEGAPVGVGVGADVCANAVAGASVGANVAVVSELMLSFERASAATHVDEDADCSGNGAAVDADASLGVGSQEGGYRYVRVVGDDDCEDASSDVVWARISSVGANVGTAEGFSMETDVGSGMGAGVGAGVEVPVRCSMGKSVGRVELAPTGKSVGRVEIAGMDVFGSDRPPGLKTTMLSRLPASCSIMAFVNAVFERWAHSSFWSGKPLFFSISTTAWGVHQQCFSFNGAGSPPKVS